MKPRIIILLLALAALLWGCSGTPEAGDGRITIALVDTGVSTQAITSGQLLSGYNYVTGSTDTGDRINHGTAVASIILGCESAGVTGKAPFADVVPLVIADRTEAGLEQADADTLAQVIRDAVDVYHADIINLSIGVQADSQALRSAVEYAEKKNVLLVAAVGNGGAEGAPYYPAAYETVLAVGACDRQGQRSSFSQEGADVLAQGEGFLLASRKGKPYGIKGTSFSAGIAAAQCAVLLQASPDASPAQLKAQLLAAAEASGGYFLLEE